MVIAGAGGHALEVLDVLLSLHFSKDDILFYDDYSEKKEYFGITVLKSENELKNSFSNSNQFCLGVGNPILRKKLYDIMRANGGEHYNIVSPYATISGNCQNYGADIMANCFISSKTTLGIGTLINTAANIHHEVEIGDFTEISPSSVLLGGVSIKNYCSVGANATILPKIEISDNVKVGAGAVVTKNIKSNMIVKGIPAK